MIRTIWRLFILAAAICWLGCTGNGARDDVIADFIEYMDQKNGAAEGKINFLRTDSSFGYVNSIKATAKQDVQEGEVLYSFSLKKDSICLDNALNAPIVGEVFRGMRRKDYVSESKDAGRRPILLFDDQIVRLYTLYLKHNPEIAPEWQSYFRILPSSEEMQQPLFWNEKELEELKGSRLYAAVQQSREDIKKEYRELFPRLSNAYPDIFPNDQFTLEEMTWMYSIYSSRQFGSESVQTTLLPLIETFSFVEEPSVKLVENPEGTVDIVATEEIRQGEEVFINDGMLGNRDLLELFGFVIEKNPHNVLDVGLGLDKSDSLFGNKKKLLHQRKLKDGQTYAISADEIPKELMFALRVYHVSVYDLDDARLAFEDKPISLQTEMKVVQTLMDLCKNTLGAYRTTAKEDKELLKTDLPKRLRDAVIFRRGEKKILKKTLETVKESFDEVKKGWNMRTLDIPGSGDFRASIGGQEIL